MLLLFVWLLAYLYVVRFEVFLASKHCVVVYQPLKLRILLTGPRNLSKPCFPPRLVLFIFRAWKLESVPRPFVLRYYPQPNTAQFSPGIPQKYS